MPEYEYGYSLRYVGSSLEICSPGAVQFDTVEDAIEAAANYMEWRTTVGGKNNVVASFFRRIPPVPAGEWEALDTASSS